ncbi:DUF1329 domain-containing protein [Paraburkholderia phytofirmans]|uniref:DUF1329 domain-containing protein n=1 Tax=Paraburkholderia phytofirmans TaxID=261302 RepID=UPI0038BCA447
MRLIKTALAVSVALIGLGQAFAGVSEEEAKALGTTLTAFGADPNASKDGLVPAYTGELVKAPANYNEGSGRYPDPFASEKPIFSVTQKNMAEYADKLTDGAQTLLKRYPDFRIDVYPSHRTMVYPEAVLRKTKELARTASLSEDNLRVENAWGGIPFPIPKRGAEIIWNHALAFTNVTHEALGSGYLVDSAGNTTNVGTNRILYYNPYYDPAAKPGEWAIKFVATFTGPPSSVGQKVMEYVPLDYKNKDQPIYFYTPGLRRVRLAPDLTYDTPSAAYGGAVLGDEVNMFFGKLDRFDYKIVGKKEMIVPYNTYKLHFDTPPDQMLKPHFLSPDAVRWEVHRVWVVEATLKPGARHVIKKRLYYVDEDLWSIVALDSYDASGSLYRSGFAAPYVRYGKNPDQSALTFSFYDFSKGNYMIGGVETPSGYFKNLPDTSFATQLTPDAMAGSGVR